MNVPFYSDGIIDFIEQTFSDFKCFNHETVFSEIMHVCNCKCPKLSLTMENSIFQSLRPIQLNQNIEIHSFNYCVFTDCIQFHFIYMYSFHVLFLKIVAAVTSYLWIIVYSLFNSMRQEASGKSGATSFNSPWIS